MPSGLRAEITVQMRRRVSRVAKIGNVLVTAPPACGFT